MDVSTYFLNRYALLGLLLGMFFPAFMSAQITITGVVIDAHSKESVPFANVYLQSNPSKGVAADFDGNFSISFDQMPDMLEVSALGYETLAVPYAGKNNLKIQLNSAATTLGVVEVVVDKDVEDPAYPIMRKVIKNKPKNDRDNYDAYGCEVYNKMEIDMINITDEFMNLKLNKPLRFIFEHIDSTSEDEPFLPLFVSEALSDYYAQKNPDKSKEQIKAVKMAGDAQNESVAQLLGVAQAQFNAYDNWIELIAKKFASPIADNGFTFYRYYLIDSAMVDDRLSYQIQYFPKHKGINGFYGDFWIDKASHAVKKVKMQLLEESHLNFVEKLSITLEYNQTSEGLWVPKKDYITITSTTITEPFLPPVLFKKIKENAPGIQAKRSTTYRDFYFDRERVVNNLNNAVEVLPDIYGKSDDFWQESRHIELNDAEQTAYFLVDTVRNLPIIDTWEKITSTLFTGYMWGDYIDVGNIYEFTSNNDIEGFRVKIGLRTSTGISKKFMIGGYGAYGFKDDKFKYGADLLYVFDTKPRRTFGVAYIHDYSITPNFNPYFSVAGRGLGSSFFLRRTNIPFKLLDVKSLTANYYHEWESGFSVKFDVANQRFNPLFNFTYKPNDATVVTDYKISEAGITLRYAHDETFLSGTFLRTSLGSRFPVISLRYGRGFDNVLGGDLSFDELELTVTDRYRWGAIGYTNYRIKAGKVWGTLPYLNLFVAEGNEFYLMSEKTFNTIPEYSFISDQYAFIGIDHHFDGFLLQAIPLFRKMKIRAVGTFKALIGNLTDDNRRVNEDNLFANTSETDDVRLLVPDREPLMETSVGVENVFRFFRFDAVWRLNYHELKGSRFGIRGAVRFNL